MILRIEVPMLPPRKLSPNYRPFDIHWAVRRRAAEEFRSAIYFQARSVMASYYWKLVEKAVVKPTFVVATHRRRDADNYIAMLKPAVDALVQAQVVVDDDSEHLTIETPEFVVDKSRAPMTILEVSEIK